MSDKKTNFIKIEKDTFYDLTRTTLRYLDTLDITSQSEEQAALISSVRSLIEKFHNQRNLMELRDFCYGLFLENKRKGNMMIAQQAKCLYQTYKSELDKDESERLSVKILDQEIDRLFENSKRA